MKRRVYIESGTAYCAAGSCIGSVWDSIVSGRRNLSPLPCPASDAIPWQHVFMVSEQMPPMLNVDRKTLRTMEKQARMALHGAFLALQGSSILDSTDRSRAGLYLGLPVVEELAPHWSVLEALHEIGEDKYSIALAMREQPPFCGLSALTSSAGAHIANIFGMTGTVGICSPHADSGLEAVIEAALSIREQENNVALAGAASSKIDPPFLLNCEHFGWTRNPERIPGEGAAFVVLSASGHPAGQVQVSGYSRGFCTQDANRADVYASLLAQAVAMAGIGFRDIDWILPASGSPDEHAAFHRLSDGRQPPVSSPVAVTGDLGPALPVLGVGLAAHGLQHGRRLRHDDTHDLPREEFLPMKHALVTACGPEGQYAAVVLSREGL